MKRKSIEKIMEKNELYANIVGNICKPDIGTVYLSGHPPEQYQLNFLKDSGVFFSLMNSSGDYIGKSFQKDGHLIVIGPPGSSKTSAIAIPTLGAFDGRIIALDIKGGTNGLEGTWYEFNRHMQKKKRLKVFNPMRKECSHFDPFGLIKSDSQDNLPNNIRDLALSILPIPPGISENRVWVRLAQNLLTAALLFYFGQGYSFNKTMTAIQSKSAKSLVDEIMGYEVEDTDTQESPDGMMLAKMYASKLEGLKKEQMAGVSMDFGEFVALSTDSYIRSSFNVDGVEDIIRWEDFLSDENEYDVMLQFPEHMLEQWEPMVTLMINQLIKTLERRDDKYSCKGRKLKPVLVMLDEFPRLGTCHAIKNGLATLRSRGVTFALFIQNISQLDERYGKDGRCDILSCCTYKAILGVTEPDDQEYFSRLIGTSRYGQRNIGVSYGLDREPYGYSAGINESRERLIQPEELGTLEHDYILQTPDNFYRVKKTPFHGELFQRYLSYLRQEEKLRLLKEIACR